MRSLRSHAGFTLIEMMIVLAIIGITAALAAGVLLNGTSIGRLNESASTIQALLLRARTTAVRTNQYQKICIFRDSNSFDANAEGIVLRFQCQTPGTTGCAANTTICNNVLATAPILYAPGLVTCGAGSWCRSVDSTNDELCLGPAATCTANFNVGGPPTAAQVFALYYGRYHVSVEGFAKSQSAGPAPGAINALELTYNEMGMIDATRSTLTYTQGSIFTSDYDLCTPALVGCTGFSKFAAASYILGGPVKSRTK